MISVDLLGRTEQQFRKSRGARLLALYSYRFDDHLVPALRENLTSIVDGFIAFDDRAGTGVFSDETMRRNALVKQAQSIGAKWILMVDPDERFEPALATKVDTLTSVARPTIWSFQLREMHTPTAYRADGLWDEKQINCLYGVYENMNFDTAQLHGDRTPVDDWYQRKQSGLNLYHLKMIEPTRRKARRDLYAKLDPERRFQPKQGYDYLTDPAGVFLSEVPPERLYRPAHVEDGALWMAPITGASDDPPDVVIARAEALSRAGFVDQSAAILAEAGEGDPRLAKASFRLGHYALAAEMLDQMAKSDPAYNGAADLREMHVEALYLAGRGADCEAILAEVARSKSPTAREELLLLRHQKPGGPVKTDAPMALGWAKAPVQIRWGERASYSAKMATVVIGLNAPGELAAAVASLLAQDCQTLIVVVNTGGGNLHQVLGATLDRVVAVQTTVPTYVGAARNIGAALVRQPYVAFLASDCLAELGWVEARLKLHAAGLRGVASAVTNSAPASVVGWAYHLLLFGLRLPGSPAQLRVNYGLSYDRGLFAALGWFRPDLRIGEDSAMNQALAQIAPIEFSADVRTRHTAVTGPRRAAVDLFARGVRFAPFQPLLEKAPPKASPLILLSVIVRSYSRAVFWRCRVLCMAKHSQCHQGHPIRYWLGIALTIPFGVVYQFGRITQVGEELRARKKDAAN